MESGVDGLPECQPGQMILSPSVQSELTKIAADPAAEPPARDLSLRFGGDWRCPPMAIT
jgi:hypothetical protein